MTSWTDLKERGRLTLRSGLRRVMRRVPPGWRLLTGILLVLGGLLGFLPVLGFWMIPLGVLVAALDVRPLMRRRKLRRIAERENHPAE